MADTAERPIVKQSLKTWAPSAYMCIENMGPLWTCNIHVHVHVIGLNAHK